MHRWRIALLVSLAIAISYLDRQTLPVAIGAIRGDFPISNSVKAFLDSAFLLTYGNACLDFLLFCLHPAQIVRMNIKPVMQLFRTACLHPVRPGEKRHIENCESYYEDYDRGRHWNNLWLGRAGSVCSQPGDSCYAVARAALLSFRPALNVAL